MGHLLAWGEGFGERAAKEDSKVTTYRPRRGVIWGDMLFCRLMSSFIFLGIRCQNASCLGVVAALHRSRRPPVSTSRSATLKSKAKQPIKIIVFLLSLMSYHPDLLANFSDPATKQHSQWTFFGVEAPRTCRYVADGQVQLKLLAWRTYLPSF